MDKETNQSLNGTSKAHDFKKGAESQTKEYATQFNKLSEDAGKKVGEVAEQVRAISEDYLETGREYWDEGKKYVKSNPEKSLAMAVGIGAVLGALLVTIFGRSRRQ